MTLAILYFITLYSLSVSLFILAFRLFRIRLSCRNFISVVYFFQAFLLILLSCKCYKTQYFFCSHNSLTLLSQIDLSSNLIIIFIKVIFCSTYSQSFLSLRNLFIKVLSYVGFYLLNHVCTFLFQIMKLISYFLHYTFLLFTFFLLFISSEQKNRLFSCLEERRRKQTFSRKLVFVPYKVPKLIKMK
jgi:hypothetical protein